MKTLAELNTIITNSCGVGVTFDYAPDLLRKIHSLESKQSYQSLLNKLVNSKDPNAFRGLVLEVNFANYFIENNTSLQCDVKQENCSGDIDFLWKIKRHDVYIEMKSLGSNTCIQKSITEQLNSNHLYSISLQDDTSDIARLQRDFYQKSSPKKFNQTVKKGQINLVSIDVSELQLGCVDLGDCLLSAGGNDLVSRYYSTASRPNVTGFFESANDNNEWAQKFHTPNISGKHPRDYIHGILFLFREPCERAALSYQLSSALVWNQVLVDTQTATEFCQSFHRIIPPKM